MFGRLHSWGRRHPAVVDLLWLTPFLLLSLINLQLLRSGVAPPLGRDLGPWGFLALAVALVAPMFWMRRRPLTVFAIVSLVSFAQWLADVQPQFFNTSVLIAMYGVASRCAPRWAIGALLTSELGIFLALIQSPGDPDGRSFASSSVFVVAIWITGIYTNTRRRYLEGLEERAERAERERDQQARLATAAERARIARELHDVVAHNVSVMIVQADGAGYALSGGDPDTAREAMRTISATGRRALAEMRRMVGVLRADDSAEEYTPQPGLSQIDDLVTRVRSSGLPVDLRVTGVRQALPEGEELTVYRIVQEALTNTLKHGGPGTRATVEMEYGVRELLLRVTDDGRGAAAPRSPDGHGLVGMRERAAVFGGSVDACPRPGGGFQVTARLPVGEPAAVE
ncbi:sensor histidine kinase [Streptosporangium sandarakinum]|uniref:sensor histidine kinase n=1 Tax=Streptosporangium sandarakinum TaxID=1260955 RepID=UPI0034184D07